MMQGKFRILGVESRNYEGKTYHTVLLRAADGSTHKVDTQIGDLGRYQDKDIDLILGFKWGKYSAGVEVTGVKPS